jgi:hypothetical protein
MDEERPPSEGDGEDGIPGASPAEDPAGDSPADGGEAAVAGAPEDRGADTPEDGGAGVGDAAGGGEELLVGLAPGGAQDPMSGARHARWWGKPLTVSVTALAAMAVLTLATIAQSPDAKAGSDASAATGTTTPTATTPSTAQATTAPPATTAPAAATPSASASPPTPTASAGPTTRAAATTSARTAAQHVREAVDALRGLGDLAVAVADLDGDPDGTGAGTAYDTSDDDDNTYDTASIVKVDILAALLLRHQHAGTHPSAYQRSLATAMIEDSDNDAATALWDAIGGASGLASANRTLGLRGTDGGPDELWGLTQTTPGDQLTLLRDVFDGDGSPLSSASRTYIQGLMGSVTAGQRWGVSAADSDDAGYALKNGWLQRTATGLWDINSIGEVTYHGRHLLIAVLSSGQPSESGGIDLVEDTAVAVAKAYTR